MPLRSINTYLEQVS